MAKAGRIMQSWLVPHRRTVLMMACRVNLEVDVLAKYVERSVAASQEELRLTVEKLSARVAELEEQLRKK